MEPSRIPICAALAIVLAACSSQNDALERSNWHAERGNYYLAYAALEEVRNPESPDEEIERAYWNARLDFLVDQGRQYIFLDREREAIRFLHQALAIDEGHQETLELIARAHRRLAARATEVGEGHLVQGELEKALLAFAEALEDVPGYPDAVAGTQAVRNQFDLLHAKAQEHFLQALRKYPQLRNFEVDWHATTALENNPARADARELGVRAQRRLARDRFERAEASQESGHYGAALLGYRSVKRMEPEFEDIDARIELMVGEVEAAGIIEQAVMKLFTKNFAGASELLEKAFERSTLQRATISEIMVETRRRDYEQRYEKAKDLELQHLKKEALVAYQDIDKAWENGFLDVKTRISALELDIEAAEKAWAVAEEAEKKGEIEAAIEAYTEVQTSYRGYRDVAERLARLQNRQ